MSTKEEDFSKFRRVCELMATWSTKPVEHIIGTFYGNVRIFCGNLSYMFKVSLNGDILQMSCDQFPVKISFSKRASGMVHKGDLFITTYDSQTVIKITPAGVLEILV